MTSAYHCSKPACTNRTGRESMRVITAGPLTQMPSIIHLSHQEETLPITRVSQPAPLTPPSNDAGVKLPERLSCADGAEADLADLGCVR